ncbi:dynamin family protein [Neobacillus niacini]|uniref:dynamin family protein n=1 Tax=Neobacillus niacini TaxID=86668 RepID=UPI0030008542
MSNQVLQMKYHPAKKEVEFKRFQSGIEIPIRSDSKLARYMNKKGRFVLQDHGNSFFEDITRVFDGEKVVNMEVITTKIDFEDLMQMIEFFNKENTFNIDATLLAELPNMNETYEVVKKHGEESMAILEKHRSTFWDIPLNNEVVKKCVENFAADVQREVDSIQEKIDSLGENSINLCFAGVYSAGKSALINAILGYSILPENIKSETARMFRIQSPKKNELVRIIFFIRDNYAELIWNDITKVFEFFVGPTESGSRERIQSTIYLNKEHLQHRQINEILKVLNTDTDINSDIRIFFPIPLDNDKVQFTIYDTPGTDSNYGAHQMVLKDALSEQTHSILVFVAAPNKTEGEGNNALLNYLKEAEQKDSKTSIDIGRSLFVINWADSIGPAERRELQMAEIKDKTDDSFSIKLSDKKLFFTSAKIAYAAKSKINGISTGSEEFTIKQNAGTIDDVEFGCYYNQSRSATSEYATKKMIEKSAEALKIAQEENNDLEKLFICSGLYALESEIEEYGHKYAAAVKAFAIIDSVDKALSKMKSNATSLERQNQQDINKINSEIKLVRETIQDNIQMAYEKYAVSENGPLPNHVLKSLHLDKDTLNSKVIGEPKSYIEKLLKGWFFGVGKVIYKEKHKNQINQRITTVLDDFTRNFLEMRQKLLKQLRDDFIKDVESAIKENGNLSDNAKKFVLEIRKPDIKSPRNIKEFGELYDSHKRSEKFLWAEYIDKDGFLESADRKLSAISTSLAKDYEKDFRDSLKGILSKVETEFTQNIEKYSVLLKAKHEDRKALEQLREQIAKAVTDLINCQEDLNKVIWRVKNNVE